MRASPVILATTLLVLAALSSRARAGGYELLPGGTQGVARGGAVAARPENAMMLIQNPAGLALLEGGQFLLNVDVPLHDMCYDPYGYYGWNVGTDDNTTEFGKQLGDAGTKLASGKIMPGADAYGATHLPQVCNSAPTLAVPAIAWAGKIGDRLVIAGGFLAQTDVPGLQYGGGDGTVQTVDARGISVARPTPTRYELIQEKVKFAFPPTVGAAYKIMPELQIGASFTILMLHAEATAMTNPASTTAPYNDWFVDVDTHDYFIPSGVVSVNAKPIPELDLMAALHWSDAFRGTGKIRFITNYFQTGMTSGPIPTRNGPFKISDVRVGFPWALAFAARYGGQLKDNDSPRKKKGLGDPMDRELWDVELDATYSLNNIAGAAKFQAAENLTVVTRNAGGNGDTQTVDKSAGTDNAVSHVKNSTALALGGSFSVVPREVALEAGAFYETRGVDPAYVTIDNFAFARIGFGVGALIRIGDFDLIGAYSHIFQETVTLAPPADSKTFSQHIGYANAQDPKCLATMPSSACPYNQIVDGPVVHDPKAPSASSATAVAAFRPAQAGTTMSGTSGQTPPVINAGKYTASFNVFSAGMVYHF